MRRFIQRDPLEYVDGPSALVYARGRATAAADPSGLMSKDEYEEAQAKLLKELEEEARKDPNNWTWVKHVTTSADGQRSQVFVYPVFSWIPPMFTQWEDSDEYEQWVIEEYNYMTLMLLDAEDRVTDAQSLAQALVDMQASILTKAAGLPAGPERDETLARANALTEEVEEVVDKYKREEEQRDDWQAEHRRAQRRLIEMARSR